MIRPRRAITGMSAILLPMTEDGEIDWDAVASHVERTVAAGLTPAVNMDTGFANLIDDSVRRRVLQMTADIVDGGPFVAGVYVGDRAGAAFDLDRYRIAIEAITSFGGTPIFFQSHGLTSLGDDELVDAYGSMAAETEAAYFFELGKMFAPFGKIYSEDVYRRLMLMPQMKGAKHSSLRRHPEWRRLAIRDQHRPEFRVLTGNDLAIDMVMYGSDYLLGLSTFAPDAFAARDAMWAAGDPAFYELNDVLQYLGMITFRRPVPAYKHSAAMFLKIRGQIECDETMAGSPMRPAADREILELIADQIETLMRSRP